MIKNDSTFFTSFSNSFYAISDIGNLYIAGKSRNSDILLIAKYDLNGKLIWQQSISSAANILFGLFTDVIHHSIINDTTYQIQTLLQLPNQLLSSDDSGEYFGSFIYTKSTTEIPFVLYKKVGDEFVLFKKLDLSKYNFIRDSSNVIKPYGSAKINSNGEV